MQSEMEAFHNTTSQTWPECPYSHPNQQHQSKKKGKFTYLHLL